LQIPPRRPSPWLRPRAVEEALRAGKRGMCRGPSMYLFHRLIPEFDRFFPSHGLSRKLTLGLVFGAFGLVASASGLALLSADFDSDPLRGPLVFAPEPTSAREPAIATAAVEAPAAAPAAAMAKGDRIRPCAPDAPKAGVAACDRLPPTRAEPVLAV